MEVDQQHTIRSAHALADRYAAPSERAIRKEIDRLDEHCRAFIAASPFLLLATCGGAGADCSPRGDRPGFVDVPDECTLLVPDRRGNNRLDSLRNIVDNPAVGLLFLVPGVRETLRVNGEAVISTDPTLLSRFTIADHHPTTVIVVSVRQVFIQCGKALARADLWNPDVYVDRTALPSLGTVLESHTGGLLKAADYDARAEEMGRDLY